ncbi:MAG: flagellar hook-length control protein FliK [Alphaproteobacteria bacterium]
MSVSSANEKYQDLFNVTEATRGNRDRSREDDTTKAADGTDAAALETRFAELLKGRLTANIVFTRLDNTLNLPQKVVADRQQAPIVDRREDLSNDDDVDDFDPTNSLDDKPDAVAATPSATDIDRPQADPNQAADAGAVQSDTNVAANAAQNGQGRTDGQNQAKSGDANAAAQNNAAAAAKSAQRGAVAESQPTDDIPAEMAELAKNAAKNGGNKIAATVTDHTKQVTSQPQTTLSARAAVDAEAAGKKSVAADLQAQAQADGDAAVEAEDGANNIFNRLKAQNAAGGTANAQAKNAATTGPDGTPANPAAAQAPAPQPTAAASTMARGAGTAGQFSSLTGQMQSGTSVDAASGGTATLGQNNSIQGRTAPPPTASASRPPPVPAHVVADQVAVNIQKGVAQGQDRITVQLRPQELGKVEIKMEMSHDGKMTAVVSAERPETLDMLRQDSRSLVQALNDAGMQADENSLSFSLQGENAGNDGEKQTAGGGRNGPDTSGAEDLLETGFIFEETGGFDGDGRLDVKI